MQYTTRYVEIEGRKVPFQTTPLMDAALLAAQAGERGSVKQHIGLRPSYAALSRRKLAEVIAPNRRALTPAGAQLAGMIRDERLEGEPAPAPKTPEYRVHPDITAQDRVHAIRDEVLTLIGRCWAGGEHTGTALAAFKAGLYDSARAYAQDQLAIQDRAESKNDQEPCDTCAGMGCAECRIAVNDIVTMPRGTARWRVDVVEDGAAFLRPETAPEDADGMWCRLDYLRPVLSAQ